MYPDAFLPQTSGSAALKVEQTKREPRKDEGIDFKTRMKGSLIFDCCALNTLEVSLQSYCSQLPLFDKSVT